ncbi:GNAT family N-acetyltransferase [Paenibacillus sp. LHD-117]|uniref:GNAT family N-acetyltransferase n=1 Tax=Paenibacillus sp. LHD-117 TaxID=3071412 RepID=UPI0027E05F40|nr:GNAT family N-acetyltransferase [Paenibacillus sp. LHD-117]MDQ6419726.1 GNAT family N-acetyltransferase [Paenibacillus sp. LHD-117]
MDKAKNMTEPTANVNGSRLDGASFETVGKRAVATESDSVTPEQMITVREVPCDDEGLLALIAKLDHYLSSLYPADEIFGVDLSAPATREMVFAVAFLGNRPVGCGGIRGLDDGTAELKRFYVEPDVRRAGIAGKVYGYLEHRAAEMGHTILRLETGEPQYESIGFYRKQGFYEIERFGEYVDCDSSYCMEKRISR